MTYETILASDLWVYARRRFGKNIGVAFDPANKSANRHEADAAMYSWQLGNWAIRQSGDL